MLCYKPQLLCFTNQTIPAALLQTTTAALLQTTAAALLIL
jgi:hypothetical protein